MKSQNQTDHIQFRVNNQEYKKLKTSGETYGLSVGQYSKKIALNSRLKKPYFSHEDTKNILVEISRQGNNLNQIAKKLNQLQESEIISENTEIINALRYTYGVLDETRKEYVKLCRQLQK